MKHILNIRYIESNMVRRSLLCVVLPIVIVCNSFIGASMFIKRFFEINRVAIESFVYVWKAKRD